MLQLIVIKLLYNPRDEIGHSKGPHSQSRQEILIFPPLLLVKRAVDVPIIGSLSLSLSLSLLSLSVAEFHGHTFPAYCEVFFFVGRRVVLSSVWLTIVRGSVGGSCIKPRGFFPLTRSVIRSSNNKANV